MPISDPATTGEYAEYPRGRAPGHDHNRQDDLGRDEQSPDRSNDSRKSSNFVTRRTRVKKGDSDRAADHADDEGHDGDDSRKASPQPRCGSQRRRRQMDAETTGDSRRDDQPAEEDCRDEQEDSRTAASLR